MIIIIIIIMLSKYIHINVSIIINKTKKTSFRGSKPDISFLLKRSVKHLSLAFIFVGPYIACEIPKTCRDHLDVIKICKRK